MPRRSRTSTNSAQADFEAAIGLYQGEFLADDPYEFLADDPYEQWAHVTREHLRLAYLDCLDQRRYSRAA